MLEETRLPYEAHWVDLGNGESRTEEFLALNPNGRIPAIIDPTAPGRPVMIGESIAILIYLADKSGQLLAADGHARYETIQWAIWQVSAVGPNFGNLSYYETFDGKELTDKRPRDRFANESKRLLGILNERLSDREWIMDYGYSIADISLIGWVINLVGRYKAGDIVSYQDYEHIHRWLAQALDRPAVIAGLKIPEKN